MKLVYIFQCYDEETPQGDYKNVVQVEIWSDDQKEAEKRAKEISKRPNARLKSVVEIKDPAPDRPRYCITTQAFFQETPDGRLIDFVLFELWDNDPQNAIERTKKMIDKKFYRVAKIIEKLPTEK